MQRNQGKLEDPQKNYLQDETRCTIKYANGLRVGKRKAMQRDVQIQTIHIEHDNGTARRKQGQEGNRGNKMVHVEASKWEWMYAIDLWDSLGIG